MLIARGATESTNADKQRPHDPRFVLRSFVPSSLRSVVPLSADSPFSSVRLSHKPPCATPSRENRTAREENDADGEDGGQVGGFVGLVGVGGRRDGPPLGSRTSGFAARHAEQANV